MIEECVIIGGGVAGLSAANQLIDAGVSPLLIEAGKFPSHRICGEFLSYECLPILRQWNIPISNEISQCHFYKGSDRITFDFEEYSGTSSRFILDNSLVNRAINKGVRVLSDTSVLSLTVPAKDTTYYEITLSNGQIIRSRYLMIGTGRIPGMPGIREGRDFRYRGLKAHFAGVSPGKTIEMHTFPGGYLGLSTIDPVITNVACIIDMKYCKVGDNPASFLNQLLENLYLPDFRERMAASHMIFPQWMSGQVPEFGIRNNPAWKNVFWIGDAAGSIPPISGQGLSIGITSGCMAADFYLKGDVEGFKKAWLKRYQKRFFFAKMLHRLMIHPQMSTVAFKLGKFFPGLPKNIWKLTRESFTPRT